MKHNFCHQHKRSNMPMSSNHAVVITGIGLITPLGLTVEENWRALMECLRPAGAFRRRSEKF
jgi:3-oxoacyl-(acyl-carrier-protein) synthase